MVSAGSLVPEFSPAYCSFVHQDLYSCGHMGWDTKHILPAFRLFTVQVNVTYEFSPPQWADKSYSRGHILDVY